MSTSPRPSPPAHLAWLVDARRVLKTAAGKTVRRHVVAPEL